MSLPSYANATALRGAADIASTPDADRDVATALDAASRSIERLCRGRIFYPVTATRTMDWPTQVNQNPERLWLDENELTTLTELSIGGVVAASSKYRLGGNNDNRGGPYRFIQFDDTSDTLFATGLEGAQDSISLTGVFGYADDTTAAGALNGAVSASVTSVTVTDCSQLDQGDLLTIDSEKLLVTGRQWVTTGETLADDLALETGHATIAVADGATYTTGEALLIGTERLEIVDIAGNNLIVDRSDDGTLIAAHSSGATIYAARSLQVERGAVGTTAATHADAATISRQIYPALCTRLCIAEALTELAQASAAYARVVGEGENAREASGKGIAGLRKAVANSLAVKGRVFAV